jgi:hypothetical protein
MTTTPTTVHIGPMFDGLPIERGFLSRFYDPDGTRYGFPTFGYHGAPTGLATRRQLRADGLRPNGQPVLAQILWRKGKRVAYLYRRDLAAPKRTATPAQLRAIARALTARRTCRHCGRLRDYYIPRRSGACLDCEPGGGR